MNFHSNGWRTLGAGSLSPNQILIDTGRPGGALAPSAVAAERRLVALLGADPAVNPRTIAAPFLLSPGRARADSLLYPSGQIAQVRATAYQDAGTKQAIDLGHGPPALHPGRRLFRRARDRHRRTRIRRGLPGQVLRRVPWLVVAVLVLSYLLLREFRSVVLPLKAAAMNLLSVTATYGVWSSPSSTGWAATSSA